jgi:spore germination protein KC
LLLLFAGGCKVERKDINELKFVLGSAFDYDPATKLYKIYAQVADPSAFTKGEGGGQAKSPFLVFEGEDKTIFAAIREAHKGLSRRLFWAHCDVYVISERMARQGAFSIVDFLMRDNEIRETSYLFLYRKVLQPFHYRQEHIFVCLVQFYL